MNLLTHADAPAHIDIAEPAPDRCSAGALPPEGNVTAYRLIRDNIRMCSPADDAVLSKDGLLSKFDACAAISPSRARILELLRPEDPGRDTLEAIVRPIPRRGLARPFDEDTRRFLRRALSSPSSVSRNPDRFRAERPACATQSKDREERSLADELREAERDERAGANVRREVIGEFHRRGEEIEEALERERLGKLALAVEEEEEESGLSAAARRLDRLLAESRSLHDELAGIHQDMQAQSARASRCAAAARALRAESRALRYLDDVVALLRGDVAAAERARAWPFALGARQPGRNYVV